MRCISRLYALSILVSMSPQSSSWILFKIDLWDYILSGCRLLVQRSKPVSLEYIKVASEYNRESTFPWVKDKFFDFLVFCVSQRLIEDSYELFLLPFLLSWANYRFNFDFSLLYSVQFLFPEIIGGSLSCCLSFLLSSFPFSVLKVKGFSIYSSATLGYFSFDDYCGYTFSVNSFSSCFCMDCYYCFESYTSDSTISLLTIVIMGVFCYTSKS